MKKIKKTIVVSLALSMMVSFLSAGVYADNTASKTVSDNITGPVMNQDGSARELKIENYKDARNIIEKDLNTKIYIPSFVASSQTAIQGKLMKGIGVSMYRISQEDYEKGSFMPKADLLLTDSKFTIANEQGDFVLPFKDADMKPGSHLVICVSYSIAGENSTHINKNILIDAVYLGINEVSVKPGEKLNIKSAVKGLPQGAELNVLSSPSTDSPGRYDAKIEINYDYTKTELLVPVLVTENQAANSLDTHRIYGSNRFQTNLESVRRNFISSETSIIVSGENFADALSAGPLAMKINAPIVFAGKSGITDEAVSLIRSLGTKKIIIVGGTSSIPVSVNNRFRDMSVSRIAGSNRYETSKMLISRYGPSKHLIIASGVQFADALSATPLAKKLKSPIMLVKDESSLNSVNIKSYSDAYIVGGMKSVGPDIESILKDSISNDKVYRVYGPDRQTTSLQVAQIVKYKSNILASGYSFPDALSSVNLLNLNGRNLLLTGRKEITEKEREFMQNKDNYIIGGYSTLPKSILGY